MSTCRWMDKECMCIHTDTHDGLLPWRWALKNVPGKGYNSPAFPTFTILYNHHSSLVSEQFHHFKKRIIVNHFCVVLSEHPEKEMAPHSSTLAWRIPWMEESGRLQSMGSIRVGHDWATSLSLFTFMHRRRKWQPTPVFLPGESQWRGSLVGCHLWGRTESDTTEAT